MKYFLFGYYGYQNFGDDLLVETLVSQISKRDTQAEFFVRCYNPVDILSGRENIEFTCIDKILQVENTGIFIKLFRYLKAVIAYIERSDYIVIGGG